MIDTIVGGLTGLFIMTWRPRFKPRRPTGVHQNMVKRLIPLLALGLLAMAGAASAQTYDFSGHFTEGSGTISGRLTYDPVAGEFTSANVTTGGGDLQPYGGGGPITGATYAFVQNGSSAVELVVLQGPPAPGVRGARISFSPDVTDAAPALDIYEIECFNSICSNSALRFGYVQDSFAEVAPTPVPTMTEWAMILLGVMLAGGAAVMIQRRRIAV